MMHQKLMTRTNKKVRRLTSLMIPPKKTKVRNSLSVKKLKITWIQTMKELKVKQQHLHHIPEPDHKVNQVHMEYFFGMFTDT